jgi:hypothetical protein
MLHFNIGHCINCGRPFDRPNSVKNQSWSSRELWKCPHVLLLPGRWARWNRVVEKTEDRLHLRRSLSIERLHQYDKQRILALGKSTGGRQKNVRNAKISESVRIREKRYQFRAIGRSQLGPQLGRGDFTENCIGTAEF